MKHILALVFYLTTSSCALKNTDPTTTPDSMLPDGGNVGSEDSDEPFDPADGGPWTDLGHAGEPDSGTRTTDIPVFADTPGGIDTEDTDGLDSAATPDTPDVSGPTVGKCGTAPSWCESEVRDAHGRVVLTTTDWDCDGDTSHPTEKCTRYDRTYDDNRVVALRIGPCGEAPTTCISNTGKDGEVKTTTRDKGCDGPSPTDECSVFTPQPDGSTLGTWDLGCDGSPDNCHHLRWEPSGGLGGTERVDKDLDCDGSPDICWVTVTDAQGRELTSQGDDGCDGVPETCWTYVWGDEGQPSTVTYDAGCDGPGPGDSCYTTTFDSEGKKTLIHDSACDGTPDTCLLTWFDADGREVEVGMDGNCDGTATTCILVIHEAP